jgi:hypothetical protein
MTTLSWLRSSVSPMIASRRGPEPAPRDTAHADRDPSAEPAVLELYTRSARIFGWVVTNGERTSDWMNAGHDLEVIAPVAVGTTDPAPDLGEPVTGSRLTRVPAGEVLFAVPPALPPGRHLRLHRRVIRVHFEMDAYDVRGRIHVRPGAEVGDYLLRSSRVFVPITEVELVTRGEPYVRRTLPVLIVNSRHVTRLHLVEGQRARPAPATQGHPGSTSTPTASPRADSQPVTATTLEGPVLDTADAIAQAEARPAPGEVYRALSELAALQRDKLITRVEYRKKRAEILARL